MRFELMKFDVVPVSKYCPGVVNPEKKFFELREIG
jgi:hypothetical protein